MKRPGQPVEMAPLYVLLASQESSYVTGEVYGATGGLEVSNRKFLSSHHEWIEAREATTAANEGLTHAVFQTTTSYTTLTRCSSSEGGRGNELWLLKKPQFEQ